METPLKQPHIPQFLTCLMFEHLLKYQVLMMYQDLFRHVYTSSV